MRYWYCKDTSDGQTWLYMGTIRPVKDESIVSLAAIQIDAALDSGSSHASDMKYLAEFREDLINLLRENKLIQ